MERKMKKILSVTILLVILSTFPVKVEASISKVELHYDDGTAEAGYTWTTTPGVYAVHFSGPVSTQFYRVVEVRYYIYSDPHNFKLDIRNEDEQSVFSKMVTPTSVGWFDVALGSEKITVKGDFFVAMEYSTILKPYLGADYNDPDGESYEDPWPLARITSLDWMIRAVLSPLVYAFIAIDPDTLNLRSVGKWITAYIQLPEGYNAEDIDATTILLNGTISPVLDPKYEFVTNSSEYLVDHNEDGILERMVKFDKAEVMALLSVGEATLTITGEVDGILFEGSDTIRVIGV